MTILRSYVALKDHTFARISGTSRRRTEPTNNAWSYIEIAKDTVLLHTNERGGHSGFLNQVSNSSQSFLRSLWKIPLGYKSPVRNQQRLRSFTEGNNFLWILFDLLAYSRVRRQTLKANRNTLIAREVSSGHDSFFFSFSFLFFPNKQFFITTVSRLFPSLWTIKYCIGFSRSEGIIFAKYREKANCVEG